MWFKEENGHATVRSFQQILSLTHTTPNSALAVTFGDALATAAHLATPTSDAIIVRLAGGGFTLLTRDFALRSTPCMEHVEPEPHQIARVQMASRQR